MRNRLIHFSDLNSDKICFERSIMNGESNSENRKKALKVLMNVIENDLTDRQRHCVLEYYFNHKGKFDLFNFSRRPGGTDKSIYDEFVLANKFKQYYKQNKYYTFQKRNGH